MKRANLLIVIGLIAVVAMSIYSMQGGKSAAEYQDFIANKRKENDEFMKSGKGSPFLQDSVTFEGLKYFPVNEKYNIKARLEPIENKKVVLLATSTGSEQKY